MLLHFLNTLLKGEWLYKINAVYLIAFLNFRMDELGDNLRTDVKLINMQTGESFSEKERFVFLQLPCFKKEAEECDNDFERWIYVLKNMEVMERMPWAAKDSVFRRLAKIAEVRNLTKDERAQYDASLKRYRDTVNVMQGAIQEGLQQGLEKGQRQEKLSNARKMLQLGLSIDMVKQVTGLSEEDIAKL